MSRKSKLLGSLLGVCLLLSSTSVFAADDAAKTGEGPSHPAGEDDHAGHDTGPPLIPDPDLVVFSIIAFGLFVFALKKLAWAPLIAGLDQREASRRQAAAETQSALAKAESLLGEHDAKLAAAQDEVKEIIAEARRDAERTGQDILAAAQSEAEATRARAVEDVNRAKDVAIQELFDVMSGQVAGATEHVLARALSDDDQNRLIDEALKQVATS